MSVIATSIHTHIHTHARIHTRICTHNTHAYTHTHTHTILAAVWNESEGSIPGWHGAGQGVRLQSSPGHLQPRSPPQPAICRWRLQLHSTTTTATTATTTATNEENEDRRGTDRGKELHKSTHTKSFTCSLPLSLTHSHFTFVRSIHKWLFPFNC